MKRTPPPLLDAVESAVEELTRAGLRFEVFARRGESHHVRLRHDSGPQHRHCREVGVACRIAGESRAGFAAAAGSGARAGREAARAALGTLTSAPDPLPPRDVLGSVALPPPRHACSGEEVQALARAIALAASGPRCPADLVELRVEEASASTILVTAEGFSGKAEGAGAIVELLLALPSGPLRLFRRAARSLRELDPERFVSESAAAARRLASGESLRRQLADVILTPAAAAPILVALSEYLRHNANLHANPLRRVRISKSWHLQDDRLGSLGLLPQPFDGEGIPSRRLVILRDGRVRDVWATWQEAQARGTSPGGTVRPSYREPPRSGPANLVVVPAEALSEAELLARLGDGFVIDLPAGLATVDWVRGRFSISVAATTVSSGKPKAFHPVVELRGSFRRLLAGLAGCGGEKASIPLACAVTTPHLLVRRLEVA